MSRIKEEIRQLQEQVESLKYEFRSTAQIKELYTPNNVYYLSVLWVDFHLFLKTPSGHLNLPPKVIKPDVNRRVYPIFDYGDGWSTSRGEDLFLGERSTAKYFRTIELMVGLYSERLEKMEEEQGEEDEGGEGRKIRGQVAFGGHELGKRKALECIASLGKNVEIVNYDPGEWGKRRLDTLKIMMDSGYGLPKPKFR